MENEKPKLEAILPGEANDSAPGSQPQPDAPQPPRAFTAEEAVKLLLGMMKHPEMDCSGHEAALANVEKAAYEFIMALLKNCPNNFDRLGAVRRAREAMFLGQVAITTPQVMI